MSNAVLSAKVQTLEAQVALPTMQFASLGTATPKKATKPKVNKSCTIPVASIPAIAKKGTMAYADLQKFEEGPRRPQEPVGRRHQRAGEDRHPPADHRHRQRLQGNRHHDRSMGMAQHVSADFPRFILPLSTAGYVGSRIMNDELHEER